MVGYRIWQRLAVVFRVLTQSGPKGASRGVSRLSPEWAESRHKELAFLHAKTVL
jgi:hypothetical protein